MKRHARVDAPQSDGPALTDWWPSHRQGVPQASGGFLNLLFNTSDFMARSKVLLKGFAPQCTTTAAKMSQSGTRSMPDAGWLPENSAIMGIIDDGIPVAHPVFHQGSLGTRVVSLWQQDAPDEGAGSAVPFGKRVSAADIDAARQMDGCAYRRLGLSGNGPDSPDAFRFHATHGAAVADRFCAVHHPAVDLVDHAPGRFPIVAVNLRAVLVKDTAGGFLRAAALEPILHVVLEAEALIAASGQKLPLVITFAYGMTAGGRNGADPVATYLVPVKNYWEATHDKPFHAVLPAGNSFQNRGVQAGMIANTVPHHATLRVEPGCRASTFLEIEVLKDGTAGKDDVFDLLVEVAPPGGGQGRGIDVPRHAGDTVVLQSASDGTFDPNAPVYAALFYRHRPVDPFDASGDGPLRETVTLAIQPTQKANGVEPTLAPGDRQITVHAASNKPDVLEVELRVLRNDIPDPVLPRGQKARLVDPQIRRFEGQGRPVETLDDAGAQVTRARTLNAFATGVHSIAVGAILGGAEAHIAPYSSAGPTETQKHGGHDGVTLLAQADDHALRPGTRCIGVRPGSVQRLSGTSIAAPLVARWFACRLAEGQSTDGDALRTQATQFGGIPAKRQGFGHLIP